MQCFSILQHQNSETLHSTLAPSLIRPPTHPPTHENLPNNAEEFDQPHYWAAVLGPAVAIGLSTTRFRSNTFRWVGGRVRSTTRFRSNTFRWVGGWVDGFKVRWTMRFRSNTCSWVFCSGHRASILTLSGGYVGG